jgi:hypothetical protein
VLNEQQIQSAVIYTPTFIILSNGAEVARIEGYPGEDFFWPLLNQALVKHTKYKDIAK